METLFWIGFIGAALAGLYALLQAKRVRSFSEGTERMKKIASAIREGANAYLRRQYKTVLPVFAVIFVILMVLAFAFKGGLLSHFTPFAFLTGG
ncbi:MAG: sodium/proton-translocating pyrophosphatase, partial [Clostridia bacterium]|nr:sodium/proton-translocating pyrophosphatase [Clostridia bacterium]